MPIYVFKCDKCKTYKDQLMSFSQKERIENGSETLKCSECGNNLHTVPTSGTFFITF